jgi:hypothetical protein
MATKTVVCAECGAPAAPGRFACAECGALLAAVAAAPRGWGRPTKPSAVDPGAKASPRRKRASTGSRAMPDGAAPGTPTDDAPRATPAAATVPVDPETLAVPGWFSDDASSGGSEWGDGWEEASPSGASNGTSLVAGDPVDVADSRRRLEPDAPAWQPPSSVEPSWPTSPFDPAVRETPPSVAWPAPSWPPDSWSPAPPTAAVQPALPRTPAGSYLPPSAVLDGLDGPVASVATTKRPGSMLQGRLREMVGPVELAADGPRTVILAGAGFAALGFLLPWSNVLAGSGLIGGYFSQWGVAGPGHWIALALLAALAASAAGGARTLRWPVGTAALVCASLLVGLAWPYLFGVLGRSVGVWVVLVGVVLLAAGGVLDRLARHDAEPSVVQ